MAEKMADKEQGNKQRTCCRHIRNFFSLAPEGASPINYPVLVTVVIALFGSAYSITFLFPFLPDMVLEFGYKEEDKGYYAGFIAAGMFAGRTGGSFFWGWMSDRYGRRPIMLLTTVAVGLTNIAFGFSTNIYMAVGMRFINGLFNGLVGTVKTVLYEISDDTNQAVGMSGIAMAWGSGVVLGPLISGVLSSPSKKYPDAFPEGTLFHTFPFLLPSIIAFFMSLIGFFAVWWKLPETLEHKGAKNKESETAVEALLENPDESHKDVTKSHEESPLESAFVQISITKAKSTTHLDNTPSSAFDKNPSNHVKTPLVLRKSAFSKSLGHFHASAMYEDIPDIYGLGQPLAASRDVFSQSQASVHSLTSAKSISSIPIGPSPIKNGEPLRNGLKETPTNILMETDGKPKETRVVQENGGDPVIKIECSTTEEKPHKRCCFALKEMTLCRLLRQRDVLFSVLLYSLISFVVVAFEELFVVWASTEQRLGGLGLSAAKIGVAVGGSSTGLLFIQVFLYPKVVARFGAMRVFQVSVVYLIIVSAVVPCLRFLNDETVALWVLMLTMMGVQKLCITSSFSSVSLFINNSVTPKDAGSANGLGMTFSALGRTAAPVISGSMFAWSITDGAKIGFPFDVNMAFIFLAIIFLAINILSAFTPSSLEKQKKPNSQ